MDLNEEGFFILYKPKNITSFSFTEKMRKKFKIKKAGHTGTLDPVAEGLMIVLSNRATKLFSIFSNLNKTYYVKIKLGYVSTTVDSEGEIEEVNVEKKPDLREIKEVFQPFKGKYIQEIPKLSAKKYKGKPLYWYYHKGKDVPVRKTEVVIEDIKVIRYEYPYLEIRIVVSSGTYIRSIVKDFGEKLGVGAFVFELVREKIGDFSIKEASEILRPLSDLKKYFKYLDIEDKNFERKKKEISQTLLIYNGEKLIGFFYRDKDKIKTTFL